MLKKIWRNKFDIFNYAILIILLIVFLYPLYFTVIASFSEPSEVVNGNVKLWIKGFTTEGYRNVFINKQLWIGYRNSICYTVFGTLLNLFLTVPTAYALSKKNLWKGKLIITYFVLTMYFSGGLLPTYLQVKSMGLLNKPYTLIILGGISVYNVLVVKTYFQSTISESLFEAAEIDGCSQFGQFFRVAVPLAKPVIAVITLYYAVGRWNDFYTALVYVSDSDAYPLQMVLRGILLQNQAPPMIMDKMTNEQLSSMVQRQYMADAMKYAVIFIASIPMLIIYPFVQKYFVKGVMVGAVKG